MTDPHSGNGSVPESAGNAPHAGLQRALTDIIADRRARKAFAETGLVTVADFLATPKNVLLAVKGFGERTYEKVADQLRAAAAIDVSLLPGRFLVCPLADLELGDRLLQTLADLGLQTVGDILTAAPYCGDAGLPPEDRSLIHDALDRYWQYGLDQPAPKWSHSFAQLCARLLAALDFRQQELFRRRIGIGCRPLRTRELAAHQRTNHDVVRSELATVRNQLHERAAPVLEKLSAEAQRALRAHEGIVRTHGLAPGTVLYQAARESGDATLPFRLVTFCFPTDFALIDSSLIGTSSDHVKAAQQVLRRAMQSTQLPIRLAELEAQLASRGLATDRGIVRFLIRERLKFTLSLDHAQGQMIAGRANAVADRAIEILREASGALSLEDLVFHYRDRHRSCHKGRLLEHLRTDPRLLEVGPELWTLRRRHAAEIEELAPQARRIARDIHEAGHRQNVRERMDGPPSEREAYLLISCLRRDPSLRDLGRGDFCPRDQEMSAIMRSIHRDLRKAMGELPISRFLDNQNPHRRRLVARLLSENRMFVEPAENRVDLLTNYPFNQQRLEKLRVLVDQHLSEQGGYSTMSDVLDYVQDSELRGGYLNEHLLGDLLRRHGPFETLPGGLIAQKALGLGGWIQQKTREVLRQANMPMTPEEIVAESPDLAEFASSIEHLLQNDPLIHTTDLMHYCVV